MVSKLRIIWKRTRNVPGSANKSRGWMNNSKFASFLYYSDDSTWQVVGGGELPLVNECTFARRPSDGKILYMSRAQDTQHGANPITATRIAFSLYSDDLKTNSALAPVQGIANPVCEGLLIASTSTGRFYLLLES